MLRNFLKNKKAQNTAEYALLIALVVAGVIAMQTYAQRALQARVHDASQFMASQTGIDGMGNTTQYEPYYLQSNYVSQSTSNEAKTLGTNEVAANSEEARQRSGYQTSAYTNADTNQ